MPSHSYQTTMQTFSSERIPCLFFLGLTLTCAVLAQNMVPQEKCTHCCRGPAGMPGIPGTPGQNGRRGNDGEKGMKGDMGFPGIDGTKGEMGPSGPMGEPGDRGKRGRKGDCGPKGNPGEAGQKGDRGYTGYKGKKGDRGETPKTTAKIAFSAARSKKLGPVFQETTVTFDKILTNIGESFDEYSSHFVCRVNGTYFFTTSVVGQLKIDAFAWIMMNNKHMVPLHGDGRAGHGTGSNSLILHLTVDDHLWVQLIKDSALLNDYSTFSGYLLFED
ncbi:complement C1q and tumor necrosis factor-related protein 9-like [Liolophura sinensis]|uniref:complement C1q and tumor necrosis factor-related protein 9-like n=1 Tax=Liolophura sinensis TaxID=3198878 RepID=UPI0031589880